MQHFEELRSRINRRLMALETPHREWQIEDYSWLYGALGAVPSDVMFVCENPSISGVRQAHVDTIDGNAPDIEAQWWGGQRNPAAKRFRAVLYQMGLKTTSPDARGGWNCYITNVVKEANFAGADQRSLSASDLRQQARDWADILLGARAGAAEPYVCRRWRRLQSYGTSSARKAAAADSRSSHRPLLCPR
jgi:hypothetical protein